MLDASRYACSSCTIFTDPLGCSCTIFKIFTNTSENLDLRASGVAFLRVFRGNKDTLVQALLMEVLVRVASSWDSVLLAEGGAGCGYDESRFEGGKLQLGV